MLKKKITFLALGALGGIFAFGADIKAIKSESILVNTHSVTLTCDEAVEQALANSSSIKTADIDLEIKKRAGNNAWNVFIPSVQLTDTLARTDASLSMAGFSHGRKACSFIYDCPGYGSRRLQGQ